VQGQLTKPNVVEGTHAAMAITVDTQRKILALVCKKPDFLPRFSSVVKPAYFHPSEIRIDMCRLAMEYFHKYGSGPTLDAVHQMLTTMVVSDNQKYKIAEQYFEELNLIASCPLIEEQFLTDVATTFAQATEYYILGTHLRDALVKGSIEGCTKIIPKFQEVAMIGQDRKDVGSLFSEGNWVETPPRRNVLPTMLPTLDACLSGGLAAGELGIMAAPKKNFKSGALINLGKVAMEYYGYTVVHLTMELTIPEVEDRYARNILGINRSIHTPAQMRHQLQEYMKRKRLNLITKHWPINTATVSMVKDYLRNLLALKMIDLNGKLLILCDYPGIMAEDMGTSGNNRTTAMRNNYRSMIQIAQEFNCPVWAPAQMPENSNDLAWCKEIAADAHVVLFLRRTQEEMEQNQMRIVTAVVRAGKMGETIPMLYDAANTWRWAQA